MKRWLGITTSLLMCACLTAGCGSTSSSSSNSGTSEEKTSVSGSSVPDAQTGTTSGSDGSGNVGTEVEFWNDKLVNTEQSKLDALTESEKALSGITVKFVSYPDTASYQTAIQQSVRTEDAPGMFTWWSGPQLETLVENNLLEDMTDYWDEYLVPNGVSKAVADSLTFNGKIYAVPYCTVNTNVLFNKKVFDQLGIQKPTTFDEFLDVCQTLVDNNITPIVSRNDSWAGFEWFQQLLGAYDPQLYEDVCDGTAKYTDDRVVKVMNDWKDMLDKGYFAQPMDYEDMLKTLSTGNAAMMLAGDYMISNMVDEYGTIPGEDIDTFVFPSMDSSKKSAIFYEISPLCIPTASKDKDTAKKVLETWYQKDNQTEFTKATGFICTTQAETNNACIDEYNKYVEDTDHNELHLRYYENTPDEMRDVALDELMKFELGNADVDEVLSTCQAKADEVFGS